MWVARPGGSEREQKTNKKNTESAFFCFLSSLPIRVPSPLSSHTTQNGAPACSALPTPASPARSAALSNPHTHTQTQAVSKRVQNAKSNKFHANIHKRGNVPVATVSGLGGGRARREARGADFFLIFLARARRDAPTAPRAPTHPSRSLPHPCRASHHHAAAVARAAGAGAVVGGRADCFRTATTRVFGFRFFLTSARSVHLPHPLHPTEKGQVGVLGGPRRAGLLPVRYCWVG